MFSLSKVRFSIVVSVGVAKIERSGISVTIAVITMLIGIILITGINVYKGKEF